MARYLVFLTFFYVWGIVLGRFLTTQLTLFLASLALAGAFLNIWLQRDRIGALIPYILFFMAAGSLSFNLAVEKVTDLQGFAGRSCTLAGMVADEPIWHSDRVIFPLQLDRIISQGEEHLSTATVRAILYYSEKTAPSLSYGQAIRVRGELVHPKGQRNPGGFDYGAFLRQQGMAAAFYGETSTLVIEGRSPNLSPIRGVALRVKDKMASTLQSYLPPGEGGLLVAVLFGERRVLEPPAEEGMRRSGVAHLLAVSGLHVGLLGALLFFLFRRMRTGGWASCLLLVFILFAYTYITGLKPSTLRAFIMIALGIVAVCSGRRRDLPTAVAAAALFTLIYNPLLLFHPGMQLSYAATISILLLSAPLQQLLTRYLCSFPLFAFSPWLKEYGCGLVAVTVAAQLGTLPLTAYYFKEISLVALPANILILPVMALLVGAGLIAAVVGFVVPLAASVPAFIVYPPLTYILWLTGVLSSFPFAARPVFPPRPLEMAMYYFILILAGWRLNDLPRFFPVVKTYIFSRARPVYFFAALMLVLVFAFSWWGGLAPSAQKLLEVVFLDVGQGDAIFIRTPGGRNILLDGGGRPAYLGDIERAGRLVVLPYLEHRRVRKLDMVIISHPHEDHYGGLLAVIQKKPVRLLITNKQAVNEGPYRQLLEMASEKGIPHEAVERGDKMLLEDNLWMEVLNPPPELFRGTGSDVNNNSLVLQLKYRDTSFLLTGDIEDAAARLMLAENLLPPGGVLKVPHHGGYMASFGPFLDTVEPQAAVITVGRNMFGHPHAQTLKQLEARGIELYRSDLHGAVTIRSDGYRLQVKTMLDPSPASAAHAVFPSIAPGSRFGRGSGSMVVSLLVLNNIKPLPTWSLQRHGSAPKGKILLDPYCLRQPKAEELQSGREGLWEFTVPYQIKGQGNRRGALPGLPCCR